MNKIFTRLKEIVKNDRVLYVGNHYLSIPIIDCRNGAIKNINNLHMDYGLLAESFDKDSREAKTGVGFASGCGYLAYSLYYILIKEGSRNK